MSGALPLPRSIAFFDGQSLFHAAAEAGAVRAELTGAGNVIGAYDLQIAGHARALGAALVTNNVREFERVAGLRVENWAVP